MADRSIKIVAIKGSVRPNNYTGMALDLALDELKNHNGVSVELFDPVEIHLYPPGLGGDSPDPVKMREAVTEATGIILATPEYHGSFSSIMKLAIENLGFPSVMSGKPVALMGVAAGAIGAIKSLENLRGVCSHIGAIVLPGPVSVANCREVFNEDGTCNDERTEARIRGVATNLMHYIEDNICPRVSLEAMVRGEEIPSCD
ncbi:MAG: NAD(P)H-dependent oxidoreductase [Thermodesulfobacteriota bacterium]